MARLGNVIMGHDNINDVINSPEPYLSRLIGRFGNRIAKGKFTLHGKEYYVPINDGPNSLHGGKKGFNVKVWNPELMNDHTLVLNYVSPYGEEGYSGEMKVTVEYTWTDDNEPAHRLPGLHQQEDDYQPHPSRFLRFGRYCRPDSYCGKR